MYAQENRQRRFEVLIKLFDEMRDSEPRIVLFSILQRIVTTPEDIDFRVSLANEMQRVGLNDLIEVSA